MITLFIRIHFVHVIHCILLNLSRLSYNGFIRCPLLLNRSSLVLGAPTTTAYVKRSLLLHSSFFYALILLMQWSLDIASYKHILAVLTVRISISLQHLSSIGLDEE